MTPFWSVMIPTYRTDVELVRAALESVLAARGDAAMEIVVVNDGPADDVAVLAEKFPAVTFVTNERNLGAPENFNECIRRATGEWVHVLHADDAVMPDFYEVYGAAIAARPECVMVAGPVVVVDEHDRWIGVSRVIDHADAVSIAMRHPCNFAATVVRRSAYAAVGGFEARLGHAADWEMWTRVARFGPVEWVQNPHAFYRRHDAADTAQQHASTRYLTDSLAAIDAIVSQFDDPAVRRDIGAGARMLVSDYALGVAASHQAAGRRRAALRNAWWGVRLRPNPSTIGRALDTVARAVLRRP